MKSKIIFLSLFAFLLLSCSSSDDGDMNGNLLYGKWQITDVYYANGKSIPYQQCFYNGYQEYKENGELLSFQACYNKTEKFKYTVKGDQIQIVVPRQAKDGGDLTGKAKIISLDSEWLVMEDYWNSDDGQIDPLDRETIKLRRIK